MAVTEKDVIAVSKLARIKLPTEDIKRNLEQLNSILEFFEKLKNVDTSEIDDAIHPTDGMPERADICEQCDPAVLNNAPESVCNMFVVPKVVE